MKNEKDRIRQYFNGITVPESTIEKLRALESAETPAADKKRKGGFYFRFALAAAMFALVFAVGFSFLKDGRLLTDNAVTTTAPLQSETETAQTESTDAVPTETVLQTQPEPPETSEPDEPLPTETSETQQLPMRPTETETAPSVADPTETEPIPTEPTPNDPMDPIILPEPIFAPQPIPIDYFYYTENDRDFIRITRMDTAVGKSLDITERIVDNNFDGEIEVFDCRWHVELKLLPEGEHQLCITAIE